MNRGPRRDADRAAHEAAIYAALKRACRARACRTVPQLVEATGACQTTVERVLDGLRMSGRVVADQEPGHHGAIRWRWVG